MARCQLLLLALLCGGSGLTGSPLAPQGCAEGPTFWCRSLATAVQCGAVQSCAQAGWSQAAKEDMCADCQQIVTILTRMAKDSAVKDAIQQYLTHECALLPLRMLVPHCQKVVDTYFALLIACLEGQIIPTSVCGQLGLCPTALPQDQRPEPLAGLSLDTWVLQMLQGLRLDLPGSQTQGRAGEDLPFPLPLCWMCRSFVSRIEATVPKEAIAKSMAQLCRLLPGTIGGACQCLMEKYTVTTLDLVLDKLGPRLICGMLLMCSTGENYGLGVGPGQWESRSACGCSLSLCRAASCPGHGVPGLRGSHQAGQGDRAGEQHGGGRGGRPARGLQRGPAGPAGVQERHRAAPAPAADLAAEGPGPPDHVPGTGRV